MKRALYLLTALFVIVSFSGCAAVVVGGATAAGVYSYVNGELKRTYDVPKATAVSASKAVCEELKINIDSTLDEGITTTIKGKQPNNTSVSIRIMSVSPGSTEVGVRVGTFGYFDRDQAQTVQNYLDKRI